LGRQPGAAFWIDLRDETEVVEEEDEVELEVDIVFYRLCSVE
jgi:hypothetical protein